MNILTSNALKLIQNASLNFSACDHCLIQYCVKSFSSKNSPHNSKCVFPLEILTELICLGLDITDIFVGIIWSGSHIKMGNQQSKGQITLNLITSSVLRGHFICCYLPSFFSKPLCFSNIVNQLSMCKRRNPSLYQELKLKPVLYGFQSTLPQQPFGF